MWKHRQKVPCQREIPSFQQLSLVPVLPWLFSAWGLWIPCIFTQCSPGYSSLCSTSTSYDIRDQKTPIFTPQPTYVFLKSSLNLHYLSWFISFVYVPCHWKMPSAPTTHTELKCSFWNWKIVRGNCIHSLIWQVGKMRHREEIQAERYAGREPRLLSSFALPSDHALCIQKVQDSKPS